MQGIVNSICTWVKEIYWMYCDSVSDQKCAAKRKRQKKGQSLMQGIVNSICLYWMYCDFLSDQNCATKEKWGFNLSLFVLSLLVKTSIWFISKMYLLVEYHNCSPEVGHDNYFEIDCISYLESMHKIVNAKTALRTTVYQSQ